MYLSKRDGAFYASFVKGGGTEGDGGIVKKYEIQS